jgi:hypothetical protein
MSEWSAPFPWIVDTTVKGTEYLLRLSPRCHLTYVLGPMASTLTRHVKKKTWIQKQRDR